MKPLLLAISVLFSMMLTTGCQTTTHQQTPTSIVNPQDAQPIPDSRKVTTGVFDNGMTYIIRKKTNVKNRAHLQLLVKVGSLLEDDNQRGFAHFIEHMAFNGTQDFPKKALTDYFESVGMKFGHGMNASTGFEKTLYKLNLPTDDAQVFEKGFQVLENWAHKVSFDPQEVDKERGVILEELRRKDNAAYRLRKKHLKVIYKDTIFEDRESIGLAETIKTGKSVDLTRFYQQWYQPQNMVVIAVGDVKTKQVKRLMEKYLASIPRVKNSKPIPRYTLSGHENTLISIATDPELTATSVSIRIDEQARPATTFAHQSDNIKNQLFINLFAQRLAEQIRMQKVGAITTRASFIKGFGQRHLLTLTANSQSGESKQALTFILEEAYRVAQHGFTDVEFARMKSIFIQNAQKWKKGISTSKKLVNAYVARVSNEEPLFDNNSLATFWLEKLHQITVEEVNDYARRWLQRTHNRSIIISSPTSERNSLPSDQEALMIWQLASHKKYQPYQAQTVREQLMTTLPEKGSIMSRHFDARYNSHIWQLDNGAKVILRKSERHSGRLLFQASRAGGLSLLDNETYLKSAYSAPYLDYMGVSDLSANMLKKFLIDKQIKLKTSFSVTRDTLSGESSKQDINHFMQLVHLKFVAPRKDEQDFKRGTELSYAKAEKHFNSPTIRFLDRLNQAENIHNPRYISKYSPESIHMIELNSSYRSYQQHFSNAGDFTFVFTGDFELEKMEDLITTYVASLPGHQGPKSDWSPMLNTKTKGHKELHMKEGHDQKALVMLKVFGDVTWSEERTLRLQAITSALNVLLREKIREELGGTYTINVKAGVSKQPYQSYFMNIVFNCEPERVDELVRALRSELSRVQQQGISAQLLENFKHQRLQSRKQFLQSDKYWLKNLSRLEKKPILAFDKTLYNEALNALTVKQLNSDIKIYLNAPNTFYATLLPENSDVILTSTGKKSAFALE